MQYNNEYNELLKLDWKTELSDTGTVDWRENFTLDGDNSRVYNNETLGMEVYSGPRLYNDADHTVLWTKKEFSGDMKISYEFTCLDDADLCVNILYFMATGEEGEVFGEDISTWADYRRVPSMNKYFEHMSLYHISYAAFDMETKSKYIRARIYNCDKTPLTMEPNAYDPEDFFAPMVPHKMTFIKKGNLLFMHIKTDTNEKICRWELSDGGEKTHGRLGFRQMYTRYSRYKNIEIAVLPTL